jgi:hypothetical protein
MDKEALYGSIFSEYFATSPELQILIRRRQSVAADVGVSKYSRR